MSRRAIICLCIAIAVLALPGLVFPEGAGRTGTFSDLKRDEGSGDYTGCEVRIVISPGGYSGTIQCARGWPGPLVMLHKVRYEKRQLLFTVPSGPEAGFFRGRVTSLALTGVLEKKDGTLMKLHLPRSRGFWE